jgi:hypothetical protein
MSKEAAVGVSDFWKMINPENNNLYFDKTMMIKDVIEDKAEVILITRPRRWGKTLNMSMMEYFYSSTPEEKSKIFKNLNISKTDQGKFMKMKSMPVISISFQSLKTRTFEEACKALSQLIRDIYDKHYNSFEGKLNQQETTRYQNYLGRTTDQQELEYSIFSLCLLYAKYHKENPIVLIDEYDTPLNVAYEQNDEKNNYYENMNFFFKRFFASTLKDNKFLHKACLTGVLRIARESLFSGMNNFELYTLLDKEYTQYFGFTEGELTSIEVDKNKLAEWYNGYTLYGVKLYNPWSVIMYLKKKEVGNYWVGTSENTLIKRLLLNTSIRNKQCLIDLMEGNPTTVEVCEDINYKDVMQSDHSIWSLLLFSGYLTPKKFNSNRTKTYELVIPNKEVLECFQELKILTPKIEIKGYDHKKYDLFLSHASEDKLQYATPLFDKLSKRKINVFYDNECIHLEDSIPEEVQGALKNSRMILYVLTKTFFTKPWACAELSMGIQESISKKCKIIPYFVDIGPQEVPDDFSFITTRLGCKKNDDLDTVANLIQKNLEF